MIAFSLAASIFMGGGEGNENENNFLSASDTYRWLNLIQPICFLEGKQKLGKIK